MTFFNINEKRAAIRAATEQPRKRLIDRLRQAVADAFYRIRKPDVRAGVSVHRSMADAVNHQDLDVWEGDFFNGARPSREWMRNGNAAGSAVPGSYEAEVSQPTLYVATGRRQQ